MSEALNFYLNLWMNWIIYIWYHQKIYHGNFIQKGTTVKRYQDLPRQRRRKIESSLHSRSPWRNTSSFLPLLWSSSQKNRHQRHSFDCQYPRTRLTIRDSNQIALRDKWGKRRKCSWLRRFRQRNDNKNRIFTCT